ncbi:MAG: aminoacyl-tRNA hydrolase [Ignavibacteria bacterium]|nr:aminoacyl-tRNA hydrolase [Ignavibacteria bacterium]
MKLIVGLGNPGNEYSLTRHNAGFVILDYFSDYLKTPFKPGRGDFYLAQGKYKSEDFFLLKPSTFMNNSGLAVNQFMENYREIENLNDIIIVHDDFHLPLGTIRIRLKGSDGGHNGISNIIYHLNNDEFPRMRVGIGTGSILRKDEYIDFVLTNFTETEIEKIKTMLPVYSECLLSFLSDDINITMNKYNKNFIENENDSKADME